MISFKVEGMTCGHCVKRVTKAVQGLDPTALVQASIITKTVTVDASSLAAEQVAEAITDAGYDVIPREKP